MIPEDYLDRPIEDHIDWTNASVFIQERLERIGLEEENSTMVTNILYRYLYPEDTSSTLRFAIHGIQDQQHILDCYDEVHACDSAYRMGLFIQINKIVRELTKDNKNDQDKKDPITNITVFGLMATDKRDETRRRTSQLGTDCAQAHNYVRREGHTRFCLNVELDGFVDQVREMRDMHNQEFQAFDDSMDQRTDDGEIDLHSFAITAFFQAYDKIIEKTYSAPVD